MEFELWEPLYLSILRDMGFSREEDEHAAHLLSRMLDQSKTADVSVLRKLIAGKSVVVCGNAPGLGAGIDHMDISGYVIIAADGATASLVDRDIIPDIIVTDLDGDIEKEIIANKKGSIIVVHAHGDNMDKLERYVPLLNDIIGSTQSTPLKNVYNFGGFSDGDRCVFLAKEFGASDIKLLGFDFEDKNVTSVKKKKLKWAKKLIGDIL
ncbi:6-hydroxymethylpterin diphosphokinase MptE-like protein [Methanolobus sp. ZRKC2]|uniref:6-hydroxymethylpterin diphosphokinase MptE-like protein n=1 Tax=Methanolobus sp. ZRKC2 TaxID=3125783 RepID=UPI00325530EF